VPAGFDPTVGGTVIFVDGAGAITGAPALVVATIDNTGAILTCWDMAGSGNSLLAFSTVGATLQNPYQLLGPFQNAGHGNPGDAVVGGAESRAGMIVPDTDGSVWVCTVSAPGAVWEHLTSGGGLPVVSVTYNGAGPFDISIVAPDGFSGAPAHIAFAGVASDPIGSILGANYVAIADLGAGNVVGQLTAFLGTGLVHALDASGVDQPVSFASGVVVATSLTVLPGVLTQADGGVDSALAPGVPTTLALASGVAFQPTNSGSLTFDAAISFGCLCAADGDGYTLEVSPDGVTFADLGNAEGRAGDQLLCNFFLRGQWWMRVTAVGTGLLSADVWIS